MASLSSVSLPGVEKSGLASLPTCFDPSLGAMGALDMGLPSCSSSALGKCPLSAWEPLFNRCAQPPAAHTGTKELVEPAFPGPHAE